MTASSSSAAPPEPVPGQESAPGRSGGGSETLSRPARSGAARASKANLAWAAFAALVLVRAVLLLGPLLPSREWRLPKRGLSLVAIDLTRYHQIARAPGIPYRDFPVEYPPVALAAIDALSRGSPPAPGRVSGGPVVAFSLVLDFGITALLLAGWGNRVALAYLVAGAPLSLFIYERLDLLSVALAVLAWFMLRRGRDRAGGAALALAVMTKVWPLLLVPVLPLRPTRTSLRSFALTGVGILVPWLLVGGWKAPLQVLTFRGAHGWQIESVIGSVVRIVTASEPRSEAGALRVGSSPLWATSLLLVALFAVTAWAWSRGSLLGGWRGCSLAMFASVGALLAVSPVLSPQYLSWLVPCAAVASPYSKRIPLWTAALTVLTALMWFVPASQVQFEWLVVLRNAVLILTVVVAARALARGHGDRTSG